MTTPGNYPYAAVQALWGGVRDDIALGMVESDTAALAAAQAQAMSGEDNRRRVASERPGHGAEMPLPQSPTAAGVGISDLAMPAVGLGYDVAPVSSVAQTAAYSMPNYAAPEVGGAGFQAGRQEAPVRRGVFEVGGRVFAEQAPRVDSAVLISPAVVPRRNLWSRLFRRKG